MIQSKFVLSAATAADFPKTGLPEIAMVGRSNVGKSTLINTLVKQKIARTSAAPGKTRLANYYLIQDAFYLVDLPGYGYARGLRQAQPAPSETRKAESRGGGGSQHGAPFEALITEYFDPAVKPGRLLAGVLHLIDARHPDLPQDAAAHEWVLRRGVPVAVIASKIDKLTQSQRAHTLRALGVRYGTVIAESATLGMGIPEIWKTLRAWTSATPV